MKSLAWQPQRFISWERERSVVGKGDPISLPTRLLLPLSSSLHLFWDWPTTCYPLDLVRVNVTQKSPSGLETKITSLGCFSWSFLSDIWSECLLSNLSGLRCSIGLFRSDYSWVLMEITMVIVFEILYGSVVRWRRSLRDGAHAGACPFIKTALPVSSIKMREPELQRSR